MIPVRARLQIQAEGEQGLVPSRSLDSIYRDSKPSNLYKWGTG